MKAFASITLNLLVKIAAVTHPLSIQVYQQIYETLPLIEIHNG